MKAKHAVSVALLGGLAIACSEPAQQSASGPPFASVTDVQGVMLTILEPAAEHYWDAVGWIDDRDLGEIEIEPTTDEEWEGVLNAAYVIAESGNLLMMEDRALEDPAWIPMSQAMIDIGREAIAAAESRDKMRVFNTGAEVYYVCTNCHAAFALETLRPADERVQDGS